MKSNDNTPTFPVHANPQQLLYPKKLQRPVHPPQPLMDPAHNAKAFPLSQQPYNTAVALRDSRPIESRPHQLQKQSTAQFPAPGQPQHRSTLQHNYLAAQSSAGLPPGLMHQQHLPHTHSALQQQPYHGGMPDLQSQGWLEEDDDEDDEDMDMTIEDGNNQQLREQQPPTFNAEEWTFQCAQQNDESGLAPSTFYHQHQQQHQQYYDNYGNELDVELPPGNGLPRGGLMYMNAPPNDAFRIKNAQMGLDEDEDDAFYDDEDEDEHHQHAR